MASYGDIFIDALKFGLAPKRWLPFYILDAVFFLAGAGLLLTNISQLFGAISGTLSAGAGFVLATYGMLFIAGVIVWMLIRLLVMGAVLHQSVKPKEFSKSWQVARERYFSLLAVSVLVGAISFIASAVPYVGWLLSILVSLVFLFTMPAVIAKKMSFDDSMKDSYRMFTRKPAPVFLVWLGITLISLIIVLVFLIPGTWVVFGSFMPFMEQMAGTTAVPMIFTMLMNNAGWLVVGGLIALVGIAITNAFSLKAQMGFYFEFKKKKLFR